MVRPPTSRVMPGSSLPLRAEPWNDLIDSHQEVTALTQQAFVETWQYDYLENAVRVKNDSVPRRVGEYIITDSIITDPAALNAEGSFRINPALTGQASSWSDPSRHWGRILILAQDAMPNEVVYAYYTGTAIARLKKRYDYHDHCDIDPNDTSILVSHPSGSWQILWDNCTSDPVTPQEGWSVLRHRGIWDRTMAGIAEGTIAPGATDGQVRIHSGLANPPGDTGEVVTVSYAYSEGSSINAGDRVTVEWQSDYQIWTVYKFGGPAGSGVALPSSVFAINSGIQGHGATPPLELEHIPGATNSPDITLDEGTDQITLASAGFYRVSYNLTVTPIDLTDYVSGNETNGVAAFYRKFGFSLGGAGDSRAAQEFNPFYFHDAELEWAAGAQWTFKTAPFSLSGTAVIEASVSNSVVYIAYSTDYDLQIPPSVGTASGDISVTKLSA